MSSRKGKHTVVVIRKGELSTVHKKVIDDQVEAFEYAQALVDEYPLEEYNIVLTFFGVFDIMRYLDMIMEDTYQYLN